MKNATCIALTFTKLSASFGFTISTYRSENIFWTKFTFDFMKIGWVLYYIFPVCNQTPYRICFKLWINSLNSKYYTICLEYEWNFTRQVWYIFWYPFYSRAGKIRILLVTYHVSVPHQSLKKPGLNLTKRYFRTTLLSLELPCQSALYLRKCQFSLWIFLVKLVKFQIFFVPHRFKRM